MDIMEDFSNGSRPCAKLLEDIESEKKVQSMIIKTSTQEVSDSAKLGKSIFSSCADIYFMGEILK